MSDVQLYLLEVDKNKPEAQQIAERSAERLQSKQLKLIDLITSLEDYINNNEDGSLRAKSLAYLADVLSAVSSRVLSVQERRLLVDFVLGRIEGDIEGIGASARALIALEGLGKWDAATAAKVMRTFIGRTHPLRQFKLQTERYAIVQLVDLLLAKHRDAIRQVQEEDTDFLPTFISYFEGEKDPRNLMIVFSLLQVPMTEWDVRAHAQEMFEAVFNYFPITFKPPPDDPYGITAQDLKDRLRACIAANSEFAPHAFPQLLDKLDSTSMNTKRDVLQAIQYCVSHYETKTINLYSVTLWDALKFEILNVQEEDLAVESLKALSLIAAKFVNSEGPLNAYLRPIIKECNEHLEDAPTKQSQAAGRILHELAEAAPLVADKIVKGIMPVLFTLFQGSESIAKRRGLLEVFNEIAKAYVYLQTTHLDLNTEALQAFSNDTLEAMLRALLIAPKAEVSFRLASLDGLAHLASIRGILTEKEVGRAVDAITDVVLHEAIEGHGNIRSEAINALTDVARSCPDIVRSRSVPAFMVELPDVPRVEADYASSLEAFAQLTTERQIFDTIILRLKNKFSAAQAQHAPRDYQRSLLMAILYAFTLGSPMLQEDGVLRSDYYTDYAEPLVALLKGQTASDMDRQEVEIIGRICNAILRPQSAHFQSAVYRRNLEWVSLSAGASAKSPVESERLTPFLLYYHAAIRPEVTEAEDIIATLRLQSELALSTSPGRPNASTTLRHICLMVNKFLNPKAMEAILRVCKIEVIDLLSNAPTPQAVSVAFAIVKALLIQGRCAALTSRYLEALLHLLPTSDKATARLFATLLAPDDLLTKENHCLVSNLSKQKAFSQTVPRLTTAIRTADPATKPLYLIALSSILQHLPYSLLEPSLPDLTPSLLQTLDLAQGGEQDSTDPAVQASALAIFEAALMHNPDALAEHAPSLIVRLLNATTATRTAVDKNANAKAHAHVHRSASVRAKALQCLALVPRQLKSELVMPYCRQVVRRLLGCLDDGKRSVRVEAVRCRTIWLKLDEGNDERENGNGGDDRGE